MSNPTTEQELPLGLYWKGKRTQVDRIVLPFQSLEVIETINESRVTREKEKGTMFRTNPSEVDTSWRNKLIWGDNKYVMSALLDQYAGKIDLIYIDPPFATGANFSTTVKIGDNEEVEHTKEASAIEELAYRDTWGKGLDSFLQMMYDRLVLMRELLSERGSIYVHVDWRVCSHIRLIMDEIFGSQNFLNEIVWCYKERERKLSTYNPKHDNIYFYAKNALKSDRVFNWKEATSEYSAITRAKFKYDDNDGKGPYQIRGRNLSDSPIRAADGLSPEHEKRYPGLTYRDYLHDREGVAPRDWWEDIGIINKAADERVDYPTQKPESLIERIIKVSSKEGDLIADFFGGSGTTCTVAEKLGRRWISSDIGRFAIHTARKRLLEIEGCKPFEILNIGKYERQYWQTVNFGKKTAEQTLAEYISFILNLFHANSLPGSNWIHGKKGNKLVHVGSVEAPVTYSDVQNAIQETVRMKQKELVVLGWEWEMGLHDVIEQEAKKAGVRLQLLNIPHKVMDKRAVDANDVQFFELAYLETDVKKTKTGYVISLDDFQIPNGDLIPEEVQKMISKWSDYIDYWSVDWDYKNDTFHNMWQSYRTKKDRSLQLKTDPHEYTKKGTYKVMIKVIDIFGNDTTHQLDIKHA